MILKKIIQLSVLCNIITALASNSYIQIVEKTRGREELGSQALPDRRRDLDEIAFDGVILSCLNCRQKTFFRCDDCHIAPYCSAACEYFDYKRHAPECKKDA